ncbi:unnamed protein product [Staurois parvus]|uniref:Secreted protein n=1 Tax=Staurois parvus TaxID=386267 RepID=A0ABN9AAP0_9NEOB|nr:unnamed protein product [Staurois parvus]
MDLPVMVGLTCLVGCSTRAGQWVVPAIRDSTLQPAKHLKLIMQVYLGDGQTCSLRLGVGPCIFFLGPCDPDLFLLFHPWLVPRPFSA